MFNKQDLKVQLHEEFKKELDTERWATMFEHQSKVTAGNGYALKEAEIFLSGVQC